MKRFFQSRDFKPSIHWQVVFCTTLDFEAELLKASLSDAGIDAVIFTKRDRMFSFFAHEQPIELLVRSESVEEATKLIDEYHRQNAAINSLSKEQSN
jgi:hypothetical protein